MGTIGPQVQQWLLRTKLFDVVAIQFIQTMGHVLVSLAVELPYNIQHVKYNRQGYAE